MAGVQTYIPIQSVSLTTGAGSVTLGAGGTIPQTYTDLRLIISAKTVSSNAQITGTLNSDGASHYSRTILWTSGSGSTRGSNRDNTSTGWGTDYYGIVTPTRFNTNISDLINYSNTNLYKTIISRTGNADQGLDAVVCLWQKIDGINSITLTIGGGGFASGSIFTLFGIKAV
jgi:hypothetical protein